MKQEKKLVAEIKRTAKTGNEVRCELIFYLLKELLPWPLLVNCI